MSTKFFSDGATQAYFNPYETPYEAYINYMNVLSDFTIRVNSFVPESSGEQEIANLSQVITEKDALISKYEAELKRLKSTKTKIESALKSPAVKVQSKAQPQARKTARPKSRAKSKPEAHTKQHQKTQLKTQPKTRAKAKTVKKAKSGSPAKSAAKSKKPALSKKERTKKPKAGKK
jgi:alpha-amylase